MKVLLVNDYGYIAGGVERCVALLKYELAQRGHDVLVLSSDHKDSSNQADHFSNMELPEIDRAGLSKLTKIFKHLWYVRSYITLRKVIKEFQPDVIHFHMTSQFSPSVLFSIGKTPAVLTVHGAEEYTTSILEWSFPREFFVNGDIGSKDYTLTGKMNKFFFNHAQRPVYVLGFHRSIRKMIAPSKYIGRVLESEQFRVPITVIYNGIPLPGPSPIRNRNRVLFVGRLEYAKGVHVLLDAMRTVIKEIPDVHLDIVGDGSTKNELVALARKLQVTENITFHGWLSGKRLDNMYVETTASCVPSIWPEALGIVCIEALAHGRPVIGSNIGGIPEVINNRTGKVVPPNDPLALAEGIISILKSKDDYEKVCASSAKRFRTEKFIDEHEKLYKQLIEL